MKKGIILLLIASLLTGCQEKKYYEFSKDGINNIDFSCAKTLDIQLHSQEYLLFDLSNLKCLYAYGCDTRMYPASLTKILTLDTVLHCFSDLSDTSSISSKDREHLIELDSSLAGLQVNKEYTISDLLYALMLPSGGDAAIALENYFEIHDMNLVDEMNKLCEELCLQDSHFTNSTGLHDDNLYTTLNDILKISLDVLNYDVAREIFKTTKYTLQDGTIVESTLLFSKNGFVKVYGGKTGTTDESGQSVLVFYEKDNRSYLLILANAMGHHYKEYFHLEDALNVFYYLYSGE